MSKHTDAKPNTTNSDVPNDDSNKAVNQEMSTKKNEYRVHFALYTIALAFYGGTRVITSTLLESFQSQTNSTTADMSLVVTCQYFASIVSGIIAGWFLECLKNFHLFHGITTLGAAISIIIVGYITEYYFLILLWIMIGIATGINDVTVTVYLFRLYGDKAVIKGAILVAFQSVIVALSPVFIETSITYFGHYMYALCVISIFGILFFILQFFVKTPQLYKKVEVEKDPVEIDTNLTNPKEDQNPQKAGSDRTLKLENTSTRNKNSNSGGINYNRSRDISQNFGSFLLSSAIDAHVAELALNSTLINEMDKAAREQKAVNILRQAGINVGTIHSYESYNPGQNGNDAKITKSLEYLPSLNRLASNWFDVEVAIDGLSNNVKNAFGVVHGLALPSRIVQSEHDPAAIARNMYSNTNIFLGSPTGNESNYNPRVGDSNVNSNINVYDKNNDNNKNTNDTNKNKSNRETNVDEFKNNNLENYNSTTLNNNNSSNDFGKSDVRFDLARMITPPDDGEIYTAAFGIRSGDSNPANKNNNNNNDDDNDNNRSELNVISNVPRMPTVPSMNNVDINSNEKGPIIADFLDFLTNPNSNPNSNINSNLNSTLDGENVNNKENKINNHQRFSSKLNKFELPAINEDGSVVVSIVMVGDDYEKDNANANEMDDELNQSDSDENNPNIPNDVDEPNSPSGDKDEKTKPQSVNGVKNTKDRMEKEAAKNSSTSSNLKNKNSEKRASVQIKGVDKVLKVHNIDLSIIKSENDKQKKLKKMFVCAMIVSILFYRTFSSSVLTYVTIYITNYIGADSRFGRLLVSCYFISGSIARFFLAPTLKTFDCVRVLAGSLISLTSLSIIYVTCQTLWNTNIIPTPIYLVILYIIYSLIAISMCAVMNAEFGMCHKLSYLHTFVRVAFCTV